MEIAGTVIEGADESPERRLNAPLARRTVYVVDDEGSIRVIRPRYPARKDRATRDGARPQD